LLFFGDQYHLHGKVFCSCGALSSLWNCCFAAVEQYHLYGVGFFAEQYHLHGNVFCSFRAILSLWRCCFLWSNITFMVKCFAGVVHYYPYDIVVLHLWSNIILMVLLFCVEQYHLHGEMFSGCVALSSIRYYCFAAVDQSHPCGVI